MKKLIFINLLIIMNFVSCNNSNKKQNEMTGLSKWEASNQTIKNPFKYNDTLDNEKFIRKYFLGHRYKKPNYVSKYKNYDFSKIWLNKNHNVIGTIGNNNQRIKVKFIEIKKNPNNEIEYFVKGKTKIKNRIRNFTGKIEIDKIKEFLYTDYSLAEEEKKIKAQGFLIGNFLFYENKEDKNNGKFIGRIYTKWYIDKKGDLKYDDIAFFASNYTNNTFLGHWISYDDKNIIKCAWSDYQAPFGTSDLNTGDSEFKPNKKYYEKGWKDYDIENEKW